MLFAEKTVPEISKLRYKKIDLHAITFVLKYIFFLSFDFIFTVCQLYV